MDAAPPRQMTLGRSHTSPAACHSKPPDPAVVSIVVVLPSVSRIWVLPVAQAPDNERVEIAPRPVAECSVSAPPTKRPVPPPMKSLSRSHMEMCRHLVVDGFAFLPRV